MMGRSTGHDNDSRDGETATPRRRKGRGGGGGGGGGGDKGVDAPKMIAHGVLHGVACFCFILISILLTLPSHVYVGLVLLCVVP